MATVLTEALTADAMIKIAREQVDAFNRGDWEGVRAGLAPDASYDNESENARYVRAALDDVLAGRTVALAETPPVGCTIKWFVDAPDSISNHPA